MPQVFGHGFLPLLIFLLKVDLSFSRPQKKKIGSCLTVSLIARLIIIISHFLSLRIFVIIPEMKVVKALFKLSGSVLLWKTIILRSVNY